MYPNLPLTPVRDPAASGQRPHDDELLREVLTVIWAIRTGRRLPPVPVSDLSPEELVAFWADDEL